MPYLNWKQSEIRKRLDPQADSRSTLHLDFTKAQRGQILSLLKQIFDEGNAELRVDLPGNWIVFWKARDGESRLLLAHPQREEWVTTVALESTHGRRVVEKLEALEVGDVFNLNEQGEVGSVSNVEVVLGLIAGGQTP